MINTDNTTTILKDNNDNNTLIGLELFHFDNDKRHFIVYYPAPIIDIAELDGVHQIT